MLGLKQLKSKTSFCARAGLASVLAMTAMLSLATTAQAWHPSEPHPFKSASIKWAPEGVGRAKTPTLLVGHDGDNYTHLVGKISTRFKLKAKVKKGNRIYGFVVTTGDPDMTDQLPDGLIGAQKGRYTKSLETHATFTMDASTAVTSGTPGINLNLVQDIIDSCNNAFDVPPSSDQGVGQIDLTVHGGFSAGDKKFGIQFITNRAWYPDDALSRPAIVDTTFPVNIVCASDQFRSTENQVPPRASNELYSIDLKVDQHGKSCPKDVTVTAYANYRWKAKSRMRMQVNGGFPKVRFANTKMVTFAGKTFHRAEAQFNYKLDPGQKTFTLTVDGKKGKTHTETVEIKCPPFKVTSAWLKYDVEQTPTCPKKVTETATFHTTRPGWVNHEIRMKGGFVVSSGKLTSKRVGDKYVATAVRKLTLNAIDTEFMADAVDYPANSGWVPLDVKCLDLAGDFTFVDAGAPKCPRSGKALITFKSNMSDNIHYSLDCTNGQHLSGYVKPVKQANGDYVATALKTFQVNKTSVYSCALKTVQPGPVKLHQWKSHTFDCVIPAVETGSDDIQVAPRPQTRNPRVPATLVPNALDKVEADAIKRRREAAKKKAQAEVKRKREAAAKRAKEAKKKAQAEARRKREAAAKRAKEAKKKAQAEAKRKREAAIAKRKAAAAALARRKAKLKKRRTSSNSSAVRVMRLR